MKLHEIEKPKEGIELIAEQNQQKETKLLGSRKIIRGHTLYKLNLETLEVSPAEYVKKTEICWQDAKNGVIKKQVIKEKNHVYLSALNIKNAIRKFERAMRQ